MFAVAASYGPDDGGAVRRSAERCFGKFLDLLSLERVESAKAVAAERPQIFVDLMGHTFGGRYGKRRRVVSVCRSIEILISQFVLYPLRTTLVNRSKSIFNSKDLLLSGYVQVALIQGKGGQRSVKHHSEFSGFGMWVLVDGIEHICRLLYASPRKYWCRKLLGERGSRYFYFPLVVRAFRPLLHKTFSQRVFRDGMWALSVEMRALPLDSVLVGIEPQEPRFTTQLTVLHFEGSHVYGAQ